MNLSFRAVGESRTHTGQCPLPPQSSVSTISPLPQLFGTAKIGIFLEFAKKFAKFVCMDKFTSNMKVARLVEANYRLLGVLARVGIDGSFGEKTVSEVCIQSGLDPDTVILLCEVYTFPNFKPTMDRLRRCHVGDILRYLHQSHDYYLNRALTAMETAITKLLEPCQQKQQDVVWNFFRGYKVELKNHFGFEEEEVIPYVQGLIIGQSRPVSNLSIAQVKQKYGIIERENYNKPKSPNSKQPGTSDMRIKAIEEAMRHFQMI